MCVPPLLCMKWKASPSIGASSDPFSRVYPAPSLHEIREESNHFRGSGSFKVLVIVLLFVLCALFATDLLLRPGEV